MMLWNYSLEEIACGYTKTKTECKCLFCGQAYTQGRIYPIGENWYDAYGALQNHISAQHKSPAAWLLSQPSLLGLSEMQQSVLNLVLQGKEDKEISVSLGIAASTVRNYRFKLREKEKQARLFLAMITALQTETEKNIAQSDEGGIEELPTPARQVDDRYAITAAEREKTLAIYMDVQTGALKQYPAREKKKIIVLSKIAEQFKPETAYSEAQVNRILQRIYEADYPTLRRAMIEYGFLERTRDCSVYRRCV